MAQIVCNKNYMRRQKKKQRYKKRQPVIRESEAFKKQTNTTESVVKEEVKETVNDQIETKTDENLMADSNIKIGADVLRIGVAALAAAILFGIIGYLAVKTQIIDNWSEKLLDWFNLV